jgi:glucans biosynthesis protein C
MHSSRVSYLDNIRIFLTALVVLFHLISAYGAPGIWYYVETKVEFPLIIPMSIFISTTQAFFMGMFFMVSSFFLLPSLNRKGTKEFIFHRLLRLGIPLVVFYFILGPLTYFIRDKFIYGMEVKFPSYIVDPGIWYFGPMWFVESLLIFTFLFLLVRKFVQGLKLKFPGTVKILLFALVIALLQFMIRIWFPLRWSIPYTNLRIAFFVQYLALFGVGIIAWQNNWFENIKIRTSWRWFAFAQVIIIIGFPTLFVLGGAATEGETKFLGGFHWQNLVYSLWEQLVAVSMIYGLLGIFKTYLHRQGNFARQLSYGTYGVYVIHPPLLLLVSLVFLNWHIPPLLKFLALAPIALALCFLVACLVRKLPGVNRIM